MYDEVKTYVAAMKAATERYESTNATLLGGAEHTSSPFAAGCPACKAVAETADERTVADTARRSAEEGAWDALEASSDPLVRWIGKNCVGYAAAAQTVLEALPASMAELDAIAEQRGWCEEYAEFRERAAHAGVLPKDAEVSA